MAKDPTISKMTVVPMVRLRSQNASKSTFLLWALGDLANGLSHSDSDLKVRISL